jgi:hypothetical protein
VYLANKDISEALIFKIEYLACFKPGALAQPKGQLKASQALAAYGN